MVVQAFNPNMQKAKTGELYESEASMAQVVSFRVARTMCRKDKQTVQNEK